MMEAKDEKIFENSCDQLAKSTNNTFMIYFEKFLRRKEKWAFCFKKTGDKFTNTNLHVEAFHKILKYTYFKCKRNKRVDNLISMLLKISSDFEEKERIQIKRGVRVNFNTKTALRHNKSMEKNFVVEDYKVKVI